MAGDAKARDFCWIRRQSVALTVDSALSLTLRLRYSELGYCDLNLRWLTQLVFCYVFCKSCSGIVTEGDGSIDFKILQWVYG
jgi:hypothetical protein